MNEWRETMFVVQIFYTVGNDEIFGTFPSFQDAENFAVDLKYRVNSMVDTYNIRQINKV